MAKILVGIATHEPDQRFLESLPLFYAQVCKEHIAHIKWVWHKPLVDAQNEIADTLLAGDYDYLLTIEDDHHGFTLEMLEACLKPDVPVCGISYHSRHYPFMKIPMLKHSVQRNTKVPNYGGSDKYTEGYHKVDLEAFGFTLFKREIFNKLDKPYFRLNVQAGVTGPRATDIDFSERLEKAGIPMLGCFDHIVLHRDITTEGVRDLLVSGIIAKHSIHSRLQRMLEEDRKQTILNGKEKAKCQKD